MGLDIVQCISFGVYKNNIGEWRESLHHITAQLCGCHGGEVGRAGVVFAASYDSYPAQLAWSEGQHPNWGVLVFSWE